jgi:hypothetical protein
MILNKLQHGLVRAGFMSLLSLFLISQSNPAQVPRLADGDLGGTVISVSANQASIKTIANEPFLIMFGADTTFFKQVGASFKTIPAKLSDIHVGDSINVTGHLDADGTTKHSKIVMILNAQTSERLLAHGGSGTSQVSGMVEQINGSRLTVARYDQVSQVIEVGPATEFFKGSTPQSLAQLFIPGATTNHSGLEATTLAAIKIGDIVYTSGALKFPPTTPLKDNIYVANKVGVSPKPDRVVPNAKPQP